MIHGYARVSTKRQSVEKQINLLKEYKAEKIYHENISGSEVKNREQLLKMLMNINRGDKVLCCFVDRLARNKKHLKAIIEMILSQDASIYFIYEDILIDKNSSEKDIEKVLNFANFAEFELERIRSRVNM